MTRDDLERVAINKIKKCPNLIIQAGTGVGKSKVSIEILKILNTSNLKVLVVVAERAHIDNWLKEFSKWNYPVDNLNIICYASLKNYTNTNYDIIVFDEAHHLGSELRLELFSHMRSKYKIFLSATLSNHLIYTIKSIIGEIDYISLNLQEAIESSILPEPKIFLVQLTLNNTINSTTIEEDWGKKERRITYTCTYSERWKYLRNRGQYPNTHLIIKCTEKQKYDYLSEQFEYYKRKYMCCRNEIIKNKWLQCGSKRKQYLGLLKTKYAYSIINKLKDKRYICFCTNIEQAELLGGDNCIHSKKNNSLKIIDKFNNKEINNLFAVGMLQEGQNLTDINAGIIIQLDGAERSFIQRFGRTLRSSSPEQYIIYYKGTRDEEYLNNALENISKDYIKTITL